MVKYLTWNDETVSMLCKEMQSGIVVASTTDTVLGLLAAATQQGFDALNRIKGRQQKPYLLLVADGSVAQSLVARLYHARLADISKACWPGPVTCIFPSDKTVPLYMQSAQGAIGMRVPRHEGLLKLLRCTGPLFSTSANISEKEVPKEISDIDPIVLDRVVYVVQEKSVSQQKASQASTILDCTQDDIRLVRAGAFAVDEIEHRANLRIKR